MTSQNSIYNNTDESEIKCIANRIQTPDGTILWSRFEHDYVQYHDIVSDEDYMIDGGNSYCRTCVNTVPAKNMTVTDQEPWEVQRQYILRGTFYQENDKYYRVWVPICKLSNDHIKNLVMDSGMRVDTPYYREMCYRETHDIVIGEHSYKDEGVESITKMK